MNFRKFLLSSHHTWLCLCHSAQNLWTLSIPIENYFPGKTKGNYFLEQKFNVFDKWSGILRNDYGMMHSQQSCQKEMTVQDIPPLTNYSFQIEYVIKYGLSKDAFVVLHGLQHV